MPSKILNFKTLIDCLKTIFPTSRIYSELPLKVFGYDAYVHISSQFQSKLHFPGLLFTYSSMSSPFEEHFRLGHPSIFVLKVFIPNFSICHL